VNGSTHVTEVHVVHTVHVAELQTLNDTTVDANLVSEDITIDVFGSTHVIETHVDLTVHVAEFKTLNDTTADANLDSQEDTTNVNGTTHALEGIVVPTVYAIPLEIPKIGVADANLVSHDAEANASITEYIVTGNTPHGTAEEVVMLSTSIVITCLVAAMNTSTTFTCNDLATQFDSNTSAVHTSQIHVVTQMSTQVCNTMEEVISYTLTDSNQTVEMDS